MSRIFPTLTASPLQITTYLCGIALFSIAFLVFLNSSISFVVTDIIGQKTDVGDAVGTLGFADELLALVACPLWGLLSDRIGVRTVAVAGYLIIAVSLACLVQSENVYPELLVGRLGFSLGGAACSTMVTAVLPAMVAKKEDTNGNGEGEEGWHAPNGHVERVRREEEDRPGRSGSIGHANAPSVSSELTITPNRFTSTSRSRHRPGETDGLVDNHAEPSLDTASGTSHLAGLVGFFTGLGALLALLLLLPLPAHFQGTGQTPAQALRISYYLVAALAIVIALGIYFGLRHLPGESDKSLSALFHTPYDETTRTDERGNIHITLTPAPSYVRLVREAVVLGFTDPSIALGYIGGFVARASSVGISLFIPLFVNAYFVRNGLCTSNPDNLTDIKENCKRAYTLASALTGIAETAALLCAPLFGWLGGRVVKGRSELPLLGASLVGVGGYIAFGFLRNPDAFHGEGGEWAFLAVILIGISQIGCIVCSLGLLARGINNQTASPSGGTEEEDDTKRPQRPDIFDDPLEETARNQMPAFTGGETAPLLPQYPPGGYSREDERKKLDRTHLKGSIAGVYSFAGGAGILLLTKLGGALFDSWSTGAPFFLLAIFNGVLALAVVAVGGAQLLGRSRRRRDAVSRETTGIEEG